MPLTELHLCVKYSVKCQRSHEDLILALEDFKGSLLHLYNLLFIVNLEDKVWASTFSLPGLTTTHSSLSWELACFFNWLLDLAWLKEEPWLNQLSASGPFPLNHPVQRTRSIILNQYIFLLPYSNPLSGSTLPTGQTVSCQCKTVCIYPTSLKKPWAL